jgi:hypothetical protein
MGYNFNTKIMKKILLLLACAGLFGVSCSKKTTPKTEDVEVFMPCSGNEFMTNDKYLRASATGLGGDINIAKKKALANASSELATSMNQLVERVVVNYVNSYQVGENEDGAQKFEDMAKIVVKEKLSGVRVICEKTMKTPEGKYRVHIAIELAGDELLQGINNRASKELKDNTKLRIDYDYEKFKKEFEAEMKKLEEQNK